MTLITTSTLECQHFVECSEITINQGADPNVTSHEGFGNFEGFSRLEESTLSFEQNIHVVNVQNGYTAVYRTFPLRSQTVKFLFN